MNPKENRELIAELNELGFRWEYTRNGHIKAVAPDGKTFTFSTGGSYRSQMNQRARIRRWKRHNAPAEMVEVIEESSTPDEWGMVILEEMAPGVPFTALDVANLTDLSKDQASSAIEYLSEMEILHKTDAGYAIPTESEVTVSLSPLAVTAIEAMIEAVCQEVRGDDAETFKLANEAFKSENAKLRSEILDANGEVTLAKDQVKILHQQIKDMEDLITQWRTESERMQSANAKLREIVDRRDKENNELKEEVSKLKIIAKKYSELKKLFSS